MVSSVVWCGTCRSVAYLELATRRDDEFLDGGVYRGLDFGRLGHELSNVHEVLALDRCPSDGKGATNLCGPVPLRKDLRCRTRTLRRGWLGSLELVPRCVVPGEKKEAWRGWRCGAVMHKRHEATGELQRELTWPCL